MMWKQIRIPMLAAGLVLSLLLSGCTRKEEKAAEKVPAPEFTLEDLSGKIIRLADLKGKVVLLDFWATWCPPCREALPGLERLHEAYHDKGLSVIGVSLDDGEWDDVKAFLKEYRISYPVLKGTEEISTTYRVRNIPVFFLIDRTGIIVKQYLGGDVEGDLEKTIRGLL